MKVTRIAPICFMMFLFVGLSGCESTDTRIKKHEHTFLGLSQPEQQRVRDGVVQVGDPADLVYIAFGKPDHHNTIVTSGGRTRTVWTYTKKQTMKESSRITSTDVRGRNMAIEDIYRVFSVICREVTFLDDRVIQVHDPEAERQALAALAPR